MVLTVLGWSAAVGRPYYLSSSEGDDLNPGTLQSPWKTLEKISGVSLRPGDAVFFKKGDRFDGHFVVNGSGSKGQPIVITSYGEGAKPVLTGEAGAEQGGDYREAVYVNNHDNLVFDGLEVNNERQSTRTGVRDVDAYGLHVHNSGTQVLKNFILRNMTFQNVYAVKPMNNPEDFDGLEVAGVRFFSARNQRAGNEKNIQNILVEDCFFTDIQRLGVHIKHGGAKEGVGNDAINRNANIIVRNNRFDHLGGTSVLPLRTYNCLIEKNIFDHPGASTDPRMPGRGSSVWTWRCINTVIQHNQCLSTRGYLDSHGIHIDHENVNTFVQYNYMEDCEGGFVEILGGNVNAVYRYNVSVNDGWRKNLKWKNSNHTIWINQVAAGKKIHLCENSYIYNNTVVMDKGYSTAIEINAKNTFIFNNIFYSGNGSAMGRQHVVMKSNGTLLYMRNNLFHGDVDRRFLELDESPVKGNPGFLGKGAGADRYQIGADSPALGQGVAKLGPPVPGAGKGVFKNVAAYPAVDFFGNPLGRPPCIGAFSFKK